MDTLAQYDACLATCEDLFKRKTQDYGTAWRILRPSSLTDQIFIKANRIRTIQQVGESKVDEGVESEFIGIVNYCFMAMLQCRLPEDAPMELSVRKPTVCTTRPKTRPARSCKRRTTTTVRPGVTCAFPP